MTTFMARSRTVTQLFRYSPIVLFIAGAISVLVFQMGTIAVLHALGLAGAPFAYGATKPMGVPQTWSFAFWGGVWGVIYGLVEQRFPRGPMYYATAFIFGAILPTLVLWFVVFPLKGLPMAAGWNANRMIAQLLAHGMFGLGIALLLKWASLATLRSGPPERG
jgi:hypothetical protein